jgi:hypothetical protein
MLERLHYNVKVSDSPKWSAILKLSAKQIRYFARPAGTELNRCCRGQQASGNGIEGMGEGRFRVGPIIF